MDGHFKTHRTCKWKKSLKKQKRATSRGRNYRFMDKGNEVALVVMERDVIERAAFPWNRTPSCIKDGDWVGWAVLNDVHDAEFKWVRGRESLQKHPRCIHNGFFSSDGCTRAKGHPLRLARVEESQRQTAGILVKDDKAEKIARILNYKYTVAE